MDMQELTTAMNAYFADLNQQEQYGWIAVLAGFLLVIVGIILLFW
jgi:hypothetical protein